MPARPALLAAALLVAGACSACAPAGAAAGPVELTVWTHGGTEAELATLEQQVADWDGGRDDVRVDLVHVPEGEYADRVQAAIVTGDLPDVLDVDGPSVAFYAHQGALAPLEDLLGAAVVDEALPSLVAQGTWGGHLYALGAFESGLSLFADRSRLEQVGVRVPTGPDDAWTGEEFAAVLAALAAGDEDGLVLDLKQSYGPGEWLTYGFAPLLSSAGGGLLDPATGRAGGVLDSAGSVRALTALQQWAGYADPDPDGTAFVERRAALSWVGHWEYVRYVEALGDDLVLLPLPDLGSGSRSGTGSWAWAVAATSGHPDVAAGLLEHLLAPAQVLATTAANGAVPGTTTTLAADPGHQVGADRWLYAEQLTRSCSPSAPAAGCVGVPRPVTPGYPRLTTSFALAVADVLDGADPATALARAAAAVDADIDANGGYTAAEHAH